MLEPQGARTLRPVWSADGTKIVFERAADIYTMNSDGSEQINLTNSTGRDCNATWSPDGTKIAFGSTPYEDPYCGGPTQDIYVMNADGTGQAKLTDYYGPDADPVWSPDGTKIAFTRTQYYYSCSGCEGRETSRVFTMNADGSNDLQRTDGAFNSTDPDWSPDGARIAFSRNAVIYTMDFDGTDLVRVSTDSVNDYSPAYSPDGTKIAFTSSRISGNDEVYTMDLYGRGLANITNDVADDSTPDWQPVDNTPPADTASPTASVTINFDKLRTASRTVKVAAGAADPSPSSGFPSKSMRLKNAGGSWTAWQPQTASKDWKLTRGVGKKTVYVQYRDVAGNVSAKASDSIIYRP